MVKKKIKRVVYVPHQADRVQLSNEQEVLKQGKGGSFWQVIVGYIDKNIEELQAQEDGQDLKDLPADQYKLESQILKAKKSYLKELKKYLIEIHDLESKYTG